jgi:hypothetical protein
MLIPRRPNSSKLALLPLLCVLASCATPDTGRRAESATSAEALLAEATDEIKRILHLHLASIGNAH